MVDQTIEQAKKKVQIARQQIEKKRQEAQNVTKQLEQSRQSLPDLTSQQALRGQKYGKGLKGRDIRRQVLSAEQSISERVGLVKDYKKGISDYEKQVISTERQIKGIEDERKAFERAKDLVEEGKGSEYYRFLDDKELKYFKKLKALRRASEAQFEEFQTDPEMLSKRVSELTTRGLTSEQAYKKLGVRLKEEIKELPDLKDITKTLPREDRYEFDKSFSQLATPSVFRGELFPIISAQEQKMSVVPTKVDEVIKPSKIDKIKDVLFMKPPTPTKEYYVSGFGGVGAMTISPDITKSTLETRPLTDIERIKIEEAQYKGSLKGVKDVVFERAKVGYGRIERGIDVISDIKIPSIELPTRTVGEIVSGAREGVSSTFKMSARGWEDILKTTGTKTTKTIPEQKVPLYQKSTLLDFGTEKEREAYPVTIPERKQTTFLGAIPKVVEKGEIGLYFYPPTAIPMLVGDIMVPTEKIKKVDIEANKIFNEEYKKYKETPLEEGFEHYSKEEYKKLVLPELKEDLIKGYRIQRGVAGGFLLGMGGYQALKGFRGVRKTTITYGGKDNSLSLIGKPTKQEKLFGKTVTYYDEVKGTGRTIKEGEKVIIEKQTLFGYKKVFSGTPYGKVGSKEYKETIKLLKKRGMTEQEARNYIRLKQPKKIKEEFIGKAIVEEIEGRKKITLIGQETSKPIVLDLGSIKTRGGTGKIRYVESVGEPIKEDLLKSVVKIKEFPLTKQGSPYSKLPRKEDTKVFEIVSKVKEKRVIPKPISISDDLLISKGEYKVYSETQATRQIFPIKKRSVDISKEIVLVEKGKPQVIVDLSKEKGIRVVELPTTPSDVKVITKEGKKSPSKFLQDMWKQEQVSELQIISIPKTPTPKPTTPRLETTKPRGAIFGEPKLTGLATTQEILTYAKTGQYEVTQVYGISPKTLDVQLQPQYMDLSISQKPILEVKQEPRQIEMLKEFTKVQPKLKTRLGEKLKEVQKPMLKQVSAQTQTQKMAQLLGQRLKPRQTQRPKPRPPKKQIIYYPSPDSVKEKTIEQAQEILGKFKVFVKKKGVDVELGEFKTVKIATKKLKKELEQTLRASGFIVKDKKKVRVELGYGFRPSKKDPFRIVEKKRRRIKRTSGEAKEIQWFRKKRKGVF